MVLGLATENRVLNALQDETTRKPSWFKAAWKATEKQDRRGVDLFVLLDVGVLPVQIKSSTTGRLEYEKKHRNSSVVVVVIRRYRDNQQIADAIFGTLGPHRITILRRRT